MSSVAKVLTKVRLPVGSRRELGENPLSGGVRDGTPTREGKRDGKRERGRGGGGKGGVGRGKARGEEEAIEGLAASLGGRGQVAPGEGR